MFGDLAFFSLDVPLAGFHWLKTAWKAEGEESGEDWVLTEPATQEWRVGSGADQFGAVRQYNPLEHAALFRVFSEVRLSRRTIQAFANEYGLLGNRGVSFVFPGGQLGFGERLTDWKIRISAMRQAVEVFDLYRAKNVEKLLLDYRHLLEAEPSATGSKFGTTRDAYRRLESLGAQDRQRWDRIDRGEWLRLAAQYVADGTNDNLTAHAFPRLEWDETEQKLDLRLVPNCLLGAMYLQFAAAISLDKSYKRCAYSRCRRYFEISKGKTRGKRMGALYCCDSHRAAAWTLANRPTS